MLTRYFVLWRLQHSAFVLPNLEINAIANFVHTMAPRLINIKNLKVNIHVSKLTKICLYYVVIQVKSKELKRLTSFMCLLVIFC